MKNPSRIVAPKNDHGVEGEKVRPAGDSRGRNRTARRTRSRDVAVAVSLASVALLVAGVRRGVELSERATDAAGYAVRRAGWMVGLV